MKPIDFFVIGSPKSGTTKFCELLDHHPDICLSDPKEPRVFCGRPDDDALPLARYEEAFAGAPDGAILGDGSVDYTCSHPRQLASPAQIARHFPDAKLIYLVRHPFDRIESHWHSSAISGWHADLPDFDKAVPNFSMFLNTTRYHSHYQRFAAYFDPAKIKVLFFEDYLANPQSFIDEAFHFLGVAPLAPIADLTTPANQTTGALVNTKLSNTLRKLPGFAAVRGRMPTPVRQLSSRLTKKHAPAKPKWTYQNLDWVRAELQVEVDVFLKLHGKPADYYRMDDAFIEDRVR